MIKLATYLYATFLISVCTLIGSAIVSFAFWAAPRVEAHYFPVVEDFVITRIVETEEEYIVFGTYNKVRDCQISKLDILSISDDGTGDSTAAVYNVRYELPDRLHNRPLGRNTFGPWNLQKSSFPENNIHADQILIIMEHECIPFWSTLTTIPPIDLIAEVTLPVR